jgi:4-carboxymuconolactone decarboxylase
MDTQELHARGEKLRRKIFGNEAVDRRQNALGEFGAPLERMINANAYGDVWSRDALPLKLKSLVVLAINAALNRPAEFRVHVQGALANGCTPEEIREVLLLLAIYAGFPAAIQAHHIAYEVLKESGR